MKNAALLLGLLLLAVGCGQVADTATTAVPAGAKMISLNLPGMTWGGCTVSVRNDLKNVAGVSNIKTDTTANTCDFAFVPGDVDLEAKLTELAETNDHIAGFSIVSQ